MSDGLVISLVWLSVEEEEEGRGWGGGGAYVVWERNTKNYIIMYQHIVYSDIVLCFY